MPMYGEIQKKHEAGPPVTVRRLWIPKRSPINAGDYFLQKTKHAFIWKKKHERRNVINNQDQLSHHHHSQSRQSNPKSKQTPLQSHDLHTTLFFPARWRLLDQSLDRLRRCQEINRLLQTGNGTTVCDNSQQTRIILTWRSRLGYR